MIYIIHHRVQVPQITLHYQLIILHQDRVEIFDRYIHSIVHTFPVNGGVLPKARELTQNNPIKGPITLLILH